MKINETNLENVLLIEPDVFEDYRGDYIETFNEERYQKEFLARNIDIKFVQDDISTSRKDVLRGIHGDAETWKLVSCLYGTIYYVVVNCDTESKRFGDWQAFILSDRNKHQVLVPANYGASFLALTDNIIFHYKQTTYYNPKGQFTYRWNDIRFNIRWPIRDPILSERDEFGGYPKE